MSEDGDPIDPESIIERRDRRLSRQGHAAVSGALATSALAVAVLSLSVALGLVGTRALYPVFMLIAPGAIGGVWLNTVLIDYVDRPVRWFRRIVGGVLGVDAAVFSAAIALGGAEFDAVRLLGAFFAVAWLVGVAAVWRFG
ncbi:hypothetical protein Hbl1158_01190 [Halobaculum sp. CBA1158]|uniref:hypothetical protein n=1 Tax=Halobaculum sp. CBA1158 TaxID=2904243 RepID=UPI001F18ACFF|nr:hypothetical protein [Halobaculum sp. CBA1158]UIP00016.1 hypothetical protein Hbl1158_01190 [Halobaculum sp. CBA1158]